MPSALNQGLITRGLVGLLGLKGRFGMNVDETLVATVGVDEFRRSPFQSTKPVGASAVQGGVVAENSYISVSPSAGVILCIDSIAYSIDAGSVVTVQRLTAANFVTLGAPLAVVFLRDFNANEPPPATGPRTASILERRTHIGALGDEVARYRTLTNVSKVIEFPDGYFLNGDDPAGINGLAVVVDALNVTFQATFFCREFRLPG